MYYFVVKEKMVDNRPALLFLTHGDDGVYWHEESLLHPDTFRFDDLEDAREARRIHRDGKIKRLPKKIYRWLRDELKLDEEVENAAVSG